LAVFFAAFFTADGFTALFAASAFFRRYSAHHFLAASAGT
jgi:hypothetical protein